MQSVSFFVTPSARLKNMLQKYEVVFFTNAELMYFRTSVANDTYWRWRKEEYSFLQKGILPQQEDLLTKELGKLRKTARRMGDLK